MKVLFPYQNHQVMIFMTHVTHLSPEINFLVNGSSGRSSWIHGKSVNWNGEEQQLSSIVRARWPSLSVVFNADDVVTHPPTWSPLRNDFMIGLNSRRQVSTPKHFLTSWSFMPVRQGRRRWMQASGKLQAVPSEGWHLNVLGEAPHWDVLNLDKVFHLNGTLY